MSQVIQLQQNKSNQQSFIITAITLAALLITLLFIRLGHPVVEDAISGVMIDFGDNQDGLGDDNLVEAGGQSSTPAEAVSNPDPTPPTPTPVKTVSTPVKAPANNTVTAVDPQAVAIAQMQKEEKIRQQQALLEQQRIAALVKKAEQERLAREAQESKHKRLVYLRKEKPAPEREQEQHLVLAQEVDKAIPNLAAIKVLNGEHLEVHPTALVPELPALDLAAAME